MAMFDQTSQPGSLRGLLQSYGQELRGWAGGITMRYAVAVALFLSAGAGIIAAIGIAIAALFHWLETTYGSNAAYGIVIGLLLFLAAASALTAIVLLKQGLPPLPRPNRHAAVAGRSIAAKAMMAASSSRRSLTKADPVTEVMIGLAAACLVGWLVSSRMGQPQARNRDR
jgi:hypothetical protein